MRTSDQNHCRKLKVWRIERVGRRAASGSGASGWGRLDSRSVAAASGAEMGSLGASFAGLMGVASTKLGRVFVVVVEDSFVVDLVDKTVVGRNEVVVLAAAVVAAADKASRVAGWRCMVAVGSQALDSDV